MKHNSVRRIALGVLIGVAIVLGVIWLLTLTLGNTTPSLRRYAGKPIQYWQQQLNSRDVGASNEAFAVVSSRVIPALIDTMLYDTNDLNLRVSVVEMLNQLPGVYINFTQAGGRRADAAEAIGELGPAAKSTVPALLQALKGKDSMVHEPAIRALGKIHSDPETIIPLLIGYLDDDALNDEAALALANYGSLARAAVPKIIPLLNAPDKDARVAAARALQKIDPETYLSATKATGNGTATNNPSARSGCDAVAKPK